VTPTLATVKFHGTLTIPSNLPSGVYSASAAPIASLNSNGTTGYATSILYATSTSKVVGAEDSLLVRSGGNLNYDYPTFVGPAFDRTTAKNFKNPKYNSVDAPIWKVGESFNPGDYYELTVSTLSLKIKSGSPTICSADGVSLKLIKEGTCSYTVYTDKTADYLAQKDDRVVTITSARTKPSFALGTVATQSSATLPLLIPGPFVYGPTGLVIPTSATPTVCYATGTYINVISGGTCTLNYATAATATQLASDVAPLTFQITRTPQTLTFIAPDRATVANKTLSLSATASSGGLVGFQTNTPTICSVSGNTLNLLKAGNCQVVATQAGTAKIDPVSLTQYVVISGPSLTPKKLVCVKSGKIKTVLTKTCPSGYKAKK
jgi:hypothetical protein